MNELIHTKVAPPVWLGNQIRRDVLLARLDEALNRRLTLVHAPAGYGKTSLLSQWRRRMDDRSVFVAWLTLEHDDNDMKRFAQYLSLALNVSDQPAEHDDAEPPAPDLPPRAALSAIISRLAREPGRVVLILDDLHRAESPAVVDFLTTLIRLAPRNCHFVIASRDYPWLGQSILAAEEQLLEFHSEDLKFSQPEAEALLGSGNDDSLALGDLDTILTRTEGWPIALQLTSLSLKRGVDHRRLIESFVAPNTDLTRYLSEQVLMTLPEETQELVLRTSILNELTGDVVNLMCDCNNGWLILERLEQQGLFLSSLAPERQAYRYHQLFAEYLRERLARRDKAQFRALHRLAADWFNERDDVAAAIDHALQAEDDELLSMILEKSGGWRLIPQGHQAIVARALSRLPESLIAARPRLMLARVYLEVKRGELCLARACYDRFVANIANTDISADLWTEIRVVGDTLADYENLPVTFDDLLAREALLRTLPLDDHLIVANISETLAAKYFEGGWIERALEPTLTAREHYQALGSLYSDIFTRFLEARIKRAQGRLKDAASILAAARAQIEDAFGPRSDLAANCASFEAELLYEQDELDAASALLEWALPHMEQSDGWVDVYAAAYLTSVRADAAAGQLDEARATIAQAKRLAARRRLRQLDLLASLCELELLIHYEPDAEPARSFADSIELDALADCMAEESPLYRPVAAAASLNRARLALVEGEHAKAVAELKQLKRWASEHGAGRLLIDVNILLAYGLQGTGEIALSQASFDEAVGGAMFQGIARPFIDGWRFVEPMLAETLDSRSQMDRFRAQFLKGVTRSRANRSTNLASQGGLNDAEATILEHLSFGYSNKEIARLIGMSPDTVKYRLKSIFKKIGVSKRRDAVRVSRERGLIVENRAAAAE